MDHPRDEIARCVEEVDKQGYATLEGALAPDFCDEFIDEIRRLEAAGPPALPASEFTGFETLRYFDLLNQAEVWQRVATVPVILSVVRRVLGPDMLLSTLGTAVIGPNETAQAIHCDDMLYGLQRPHKHLVCNTMWALSDFTEASGATRLVPGSHAFERDPDPRLRYETIPAEMPKGSICFVVGTCFHGGGANTTDERRWALTINYCAGSQRQQENLALAHTRERIASFPRELQDIVGLRPSAFQVGHVNAGDPRQILDGVDPDPV
jgi:ectoine hydroxylase-related dioxygenase (phytanoyl-CoA dioxygenase family)